MAVKITSLEVENTKRVKLVTMTPTENGLTIIGGRNNQGKTSLLDAIAWTLGGDRFRPSEPHREGSVLPPRMKITLSNGIVVERKGKNSALHVTDPTGQKSGQRLLDSFVEGFALNLPKFMEATDKEKAQTLLQIIGVGADLMTLEQQEKEKYNERHYVGQEYQKKRLYAEGLPAVPGGPTEICSATELIRQQQNILLRNAENQRKRERMGELMNRVQELEETIQLMKEELSAAEADLLIAQSDAQDLVDESTAELEDSIRRIDELNNTARINQAKAKAEQEASELGRRYGQLDTEIEDIRNRRQALLDHADLPLPDLSVKDGSLIYKGQQWDNMSGSDQLKVATAIVRKLKPECGFVLMDKLEQMDPNTLADFSRWLEQEGLQVIATRVSLGNECDLIIEDGQVAEPWVEEPNKWKAGVF